MGTGCVISILIMSRTNIYLTLTPIRKYLHRSRRNPVSKSKPRKPTPHPPTQHSSRTSSSPPASRPPSNRPNLDTDSIQSPAPSSHSSSSPAAISRPRLRYLATAPDMSLNKPVSAVPQVVNAIPAETYLGLYLRTSLLFSGKLLVLISRYRTSLHESSADQGCY